MTRRVKILFLCTGNSCRSQMAEGLCRHLHAESIDVYSAGIEAHGLNPLAVKAMSNIGIDISHHQSQTLNELDGIDLDYVITVCGHANETCPVFSGSCQRLHVGFDDPPRLAENAASQAEALFHYERVRDEIRDFVAALPEQLGMP